MNYKCFIFFLVTILSVTACGGGGGGSSEPAPTTPTTGDGGDGGDGGDDGTTPDPDPEPETDMTGERVTSASQIDEGETVNIVYRMSDISGDLTVTLEPTLSEGASNTVYDYAVQGDTVTLSLQAEDDVLMLGTIGMLVTITDESDVSISFQENLALSNASGEEKVTQLEAFVAGSSNFVSLPEETLLVQRLIPLSLMVNSSEGSSYTNVSDVNELVDEELADTVLERAEEASELLEDYKNMLADETQLDALLQTSKDDAKDFAKPASELISALSATLSAVMPDLSVNEVYISTENGMVSLFVGNSQFGSYDGDAWVYKEEYKFMTEISFPYTATCAAN